MIDKFNVVNNTMVTNAILQFLPIIMTSLALLLTTSSNLVWGFALLSFMTSISLNILLVARYETDDEYCANYFSIYKKYNNFAYIATISLLISISCHIISAIGNNVFRGLCASMTGLLVLVMILI